MTTGRQLHNLLFDALKGENMSTSISIFKLYSFFNLVEQVSFEIDSMPTFHNSYIEIVPIENGTLLVFQNVKH
jgi:hypothetical protein